MTDDLISERKQAAPLTDFNGQPSELGYYGQFGGAYIPEMLYRNVEQLRSQYLEIMYEPLFQKEFRSLLKNYGKWVRKWRMYFI